MGLSTFSQALSAYSSENFLTGLSSVFPAPTVRSSGVAARSLSLSLADISRENPATQNLNDRSLPHYHNYPSDTCYLCKSSPPICTSARSYFHHRLPPSQKPTTPPRLTPGSLTGIDMLSLSFPSPVVRVRQRTGLEAEMITRCACRISL